MMILITSLNPRANACRKLVSKKLLIKKLVNFHCIALCKTSVSSMVITMPQYDNTPYHIL